MGVFKKNKKIDIKYLGIPNLCFSLIDKDDKREKKYSKQRVERGFDDSETWALDETFTKFLLPRLKRFKEISCGIPGNLNQEQWYEILDKIIKSFELLHEDCTDRCLEPKEWKQVNAGLKLFSKWYRSLWW